MNKYKSSVEPTNLQQSLVGAVIEYNLRRNSKMRLSGSAIKEEFDNIADTFQVQITKEDYNYIREKYRPYIFRG